MHLYVFLLFKKNRPRFLLYFTNFLIIFNSGCLITMMLLTENFTPLKSHFLSKYINNFYKNVYLFDRTVESRQKSIRWREGGAGSAKDLWDGNRIRVATSTVAILDHYWILDHRKHNSVSTSSANSEEPEPRPPSCAPSTEAPSRAFWLAASLCGMAPATRPAASPFNG